MEAAARYGDAQSPVFNHEPIDGRRTKIYEHRIAFSRQCILVGKKVTDGNMFGSAI